MLPADGASGAVLGLSMAGRSYLLPPDALAYLGRGVAPSLFDAPALARRESAGRLPVTLADRGGVPKLPGVTITHTGGGTAQGYLTRAGARAFGAALDRQFAADHAHRTWCGLDYLCVAKKGYDAPTGLGSPEGIGAF